MKIWITLHSDSEDGADDVRVWLSESEAQDYIDLPENGGKLCGWEIHAREIEGNL